MLTPVVVALSGDPGGAAALLPVIEWLRADGRTNVRAFAYAQARTLWERSSIALESLDDGARGGVADRLRSLRTSLLLTGTSFNDLNLEKHFILSARRLGLPSLAVLDFWSNYRQRFCDKRGRLAFLPDRLAVMDELARKQLTRQGFDPARLVVTGQPAFGELSHWRARFSEARRAALRRALGAGYADRLVVWVSQPLSSLFGRDASNPLYPGYDEQGVLALLVGALERAGRERGESIVLAMRPHPRERPGSLAVPPSAAVKIVPAESIADGRELVMAADLVAGMTSALLVEACYLGCPTVSLQPGLRLADVLPTNASGLSQAAYRPQDVAPLVSRMLAAGSAAALSAARAAAGHQDAAARIAALIYHMLGIPAETEVPARWAS